MHKGFTLIELLIVIATIGILSGIAIVNIGNPSQSATINVVKTNARQIETVIAIQEIKRATPTEIAAEIKKIDVSLAAKVIGSKNYILEKFPNGSDNSGHGCADDFENFLTGLHDGLEIVFSRSGTPVNLSRDLEKTVFCNYLDYSPFFALLVSIQGNQDLYYCITSVRASLNRVGFYNKDTTSKGNELAAGCIGNDTNDVDFLENTRISE